MSSLYLHGLQRRFRKLLLSSAVHGVSAVRSLAVGDAYLTYLFVYLLSFLPSSFPASGSLSDEESRLFRIAGKLTDFGMLSVASVNIRGYFPSGWRAICPIQSRLKPTYELASVWCSAFFMISCGLPGVPLLWGGARFGLLVRIPEKEDGSRSVLLPGKVPRPDDTMCCWQWLHLFHLYGFTKPLAYGQLCGQVCLCFFGCI